MQPNKYSNQGTQGKASASGRKRRGDKRVLVRLRERLGDREVQVQVLDREEIASERLSGDYLDREAGLNFPNKFLGKRTVRNPARRLGSCAENAQTTEKCCRNVSVSKSCCSAEPVLNRAVDIATATSECRPSRNIVADTVKLGSKPKLTVHGLLRSECASKGGLATQQVRNEPVRA